MDGCIEWPRGRIRSGYGRLTVDGREVYAHRWTWEQHHGPIPDGMVVCHSCDNPPCVNIDHLWLGTQADNMRDKLAKKRQPMGDAHWSRRLQRGGNERLTRDQVIAIRAARAAGVRQNVLAKEYGVDPNSISNIYRRRTWKHVP